MSGFPTGRCMRNMACTKCRRQRGGRGRMPCGEEHRKAVCGRTASTVLGGAGDNDESKAKMGLT